ncbi:MAG: hypothetical protein ABII01_04445 [Candidatus Woesearchaeota archaeon]
MNETEQEPVTGRAFDSEYLNLISDGHKGIYGRFVQPIVFGRSICGIIIDAEELRRANPDHTGPHSNYLIVDLSHTRGIPVGELDLKYQDELVVLPDASPRSQGFLDSRGRPAYEDNILRARAVFHPASGRGYVPGPEPGSKN